MKKIIGIDLGGTSVKMAVVEQDGTIAEKWSIPTRILEGGKHILPDIIHSIQEFMERTQTNPTDYLGIGMGSPGKVDATTKKVIGAYNLGWSDMQEVGKAFSEAFDLPFYIGNDANVAALGEQWKGAGHGNPHVVMFTLGTGVGGGIVSHGHLVTGEGGAAGEIGHLTVDTELMTPCTCGKRGCLEAVASATGIVNLARHYALDYSATTPIKAHLDNGDDVTSKDIFDAAKDADEFAVFIVDQFVSYLGLAVSHIANTLSPSQIIIGGGVSAAGEFLRSKIEQKVKEFIFPQIRETCQIVLAELGNDAGIIGAAQLVLQEEFV